MRTIVAIIVIVMTCFMSRKLAADQAEEITGEAWQGEHHICANTNKVASGLNLTYHKPKIRLAVGQVLLGMCKGQIQRSSFSV